ncbi:MAG TPA: glycosyltransferase family 39 protein [Patescibacteria group bacterium]|nr:glycosyltransferase family 39 protein [Patescibacteria group bacterium]
MVYLFTNKLYGKAAAVFSLFLFIFEPEILAHGHYATTDLISTFFFIFVLYLYYLFRKRFDYKKMIIFSIIVGFALATKFTVLYYLLISLSIIFILEKKHKKDLLKIFYWKNKLPFVLVIFFVSCFSLWATYFFTFEPPLGYRFDTHRSITNLAKSNMLINFALTQPIPLGSYLSTIKDDIRANYSNAFEKESFFFGNHQLYGLPGYLLLIILFIKTPIPLLILFFTSLIYYFKKSNISYILLIPIITILATSLFTHVLLVLRYILSVYPLMIIFSSQVINMINKKNSFSLILLILSIWYITGTLNVYPHYLSYFNEFVGGEKNGYNYLADANCDWGQGLIDLAQYQKTKHINNLQLAYFGTALPSNYGINYKRIKDRSIVQNKNIVPLDIKNNIIAISVTCWHFCGYDHIPTLKNKKPVDIVGGSILIFKE